MNANNTIESGSAGLGCRSGTHNYSQIELTVLDAQSPGQSTYSQTPQHLSTPTINFQSTPTQFTQIAPTVSNHLNHNNSLTWAISLNNGQSYLYWNGSAWTEQLNPTTGNSLETFNIHLDELSIPNGAQVRLKAIFQSGTGQNTPVLSGLSISYY